MFWDPHKLLSYNCLINMVQGSRGGGKTYGMKKYGIKKFLKTGRKFVYLRRYKTELLDIDKFFADVSQEFPKHEFEVKGKNLLVDGKVCGYAVALSTALQKKSTSYHDVDLIIYDEYVIDSKIIHYLNNECIQLLEYIESVFRMRDNGRIVMLSNAVSCVNPFTIFWNLNIKQEKRFQKFGQILVENVKNEEFIQEKYKTRFGQLIKGTKYGDYAVENVYLKDSMSFVEKKTGNARYRFSIVYNGFTYGVWVDHKQGLLFVSEDVDPYYPLTYVLTDEDHQPNMMLIKTRRKSDMLGQVVTAYENGFLRFESMKVKNQTMEILKLLH